MEVTFHNKRALVTGAGKGIGRAVAVALAAGGAHTVALSRTQQDLDSLVKQCPGITPLCVDLSNWAATKAALENVGPIDLLVNNAGITILDKFLDVKPEDFDRLFSVNVKSYICVAQVIAGGMVARGEGGSIVNVSSLGSKLAMVDHTLYCSAKGAVDQLTRVMALELGPHKIRVNAVNPTVVMTKMGRKAWSDEEKAENALKRIPLGRFADECDVVEPILYLLSDKAALINGAMLSVDGGWTVA